MRKNEIFNVKNLTRLALVAAMYVAVTIAVQHLAFLEIQFRISEVLVLLCFYRKDYAPSLIVGCFIANLLLSPLGLIDIFLGTLATAVAVIPMYYMKNIYLAALLPIVSNGIIVGIELAVVYGTSVWFNMLTVALGELVVVGILGVLIFKLIFDKRPAMLRLIGSTRKTGKVKEIV